MQGFAQALAEDYGDRLDELGRDYAARVVAAAADMDRLILDLLEYSRLQRRDVPLSTLSLDAAVGAAVNRMRGELAQRGAEVTVEGAQACRVTANHAIVGQIVTNLISNATKFVKPGERASVRVSCEARGDVVRLSVSDNGIGVAPEHHRRIFNVFERLHGGEQYPGTGIGLAIVRKGAERMGGRACPTKTAIRWCGGYGSRNQSRELPGCRPSP